MNFLYCFQSDSNLYLREVVTFAHDPKVLICELYITEVTFTVGPNGHRMSVWFGSSGGGLPETS